MALPLLGTHCILLQQPQRWKNHAKEYQPLGILLAASLVVVGCDGGDGEKGDTGADGADGADALINTIDEAPGAHCQNGGFKVMAGLDTNHNDALDDDEILTSKYICNGATVMMVTMAPRLR